MENTKDQSLSEVIRSRLGFMETADKAQLKLARRMLEASHGALFGVDLMAVSALNRSLAHGAGIKSLIESRNLCCSGALLRLQIDTVLRFYATSLVDDPDGFAFAVLEGKPINKMKAKDGELLRDAYLVQSLGKQHPWLPRVYKETSGYIHLSEKHMLAALLKDPRGGGLLIKISSFDEHTPDELYLEVLEGFYAITDILAQHITDWTNFKSRPQMAERMRVLRPERLGPLNTEVTTDEADPNSSR